MTWWRLLRGDPSGVLLDADEPGLVWSTVVHVVGRPLDAPAVVRARREAREKGTAATLLRRQAPDGFWGSPSGYGARWGGTAWQLVALSSLGADPHDPRAARGCERLLEVIRPPSGGFAAGRSGAVSPCFTSEVVAALVHFGFAHHPRVREAVAWLCDRDPVRGWRCPEQRHEVSGGCAITAVGILHLVAAGSDHARRQLSGLADSAVSWMCDTGLLDGDDAIPGWTQLGHPCLGRIDIVDALHAVASGCPERICEAKDAVARMLTLQDDGGRWQACRNAPVEIEERVVTAWLTFKAAVVLRTFALAGGIVGEEERT